MAVNFPPNPSVGQKWTEGSKTYSWRGSAWLVSEQTITATALYIVTTTNASSTVSGALQVIGGVGIGVDLCV